MAAFKSCSLLLHYLTVIIGKWVLVHFGFGNRRLALFPIDDKLNVACFGIFFSFIRSLITIYLLLFI